MQSHLSEARHFDVCFGAKLVRGAYLNMERARAKQLDYPDPINESYEATNKMYEKSLLNLVDEMERLGKDSSKIGMLIATHNEESTRLGVKRYLKNSDAIGKICEAHFPLQSDKQEHQQEFGRLRSALCHVRPHHVHLG